MTPTQLRTTLTRLGLNQVQAGRLLGLDQTGRTMRRWAAGHSEIPESAAILLKLMVDGKITIKQVNEMRD